MPSEVLKKTKLKKIAIAIFMTMLIWVWADLAQDESFSLSSATITISNSRENLWISFSEKKSIQIEDIRLNGPVSQIGELKRRLNDNSLSREIFIDAEQQRLTTPGDQQLKVMDFLKTAIWIRELGLTVESCKPDIVDVNVVNLVQKDLTVQCFDEGDNLRKPASLEPQKVRMYVPEDWSGDKLTARIDLLNNEIERAKIGDISKKPYIILSQGQQKEASSFVHIRMPAEGGELSEYTITTPSFTVAMSLNMLGKFNIEVTNLPDLLNPITIRATADAKQAYESQKNALMTLYIFDRDAEKIDEEKSRKVSYNFPDDFVRKGEIELKNPQDAATARFKLVPIASGTTTP